jgi:hypothetical protein
VRPAADPPWTPRRPGYLESTNPGNDHRYMRAGFRPIGGFRAVRDDAPISAMWRDVVRAS